MKFNIKVFILKSLRLRAFAAISNSHPTIDLN